MWFLSIRPTKLYKIFNYLLLYTKVSSCYGTNLYAYVTTVVCAVRGLRLSCRLSNSLSSPL